MSQIWTNGKLPTLLQQAVSPSTIHLGPTVAAVGINEHRLRINKNIKITVDIVLGSLRALAHHKTKHNSKGHPSRYLFFRTGR